MELLFIVGVSLWFISLLFMFFVIDILKMLNDL